MIPSLPRLNIKKDKNKKYDYSDDINYDNCKHERAKVYEVEPDWEIDKVKIIVECPDCTKIGTVSGRLKYNDNEVNWQ